MSIDIECKRFYNARETVEIGKWLDANMPNPPLPEPQRWSLGCHERSYRIGIRFFNDADATFFALRWGSGEEHNESSQAS